MRELHFPGLPPLSWAHKLGGAGVEDGILSISAGPGTDWVADPITGELLCSAPAAGFMAPDVYTLSARVQSAFAGTFDAGVLMVHQDDST